VKKGGPGKVKKIEREERLPYSFLLLGGVEKARELLNRIKWSLIEHVQESPGGGENWITG